MLGMAFIGLVGVGWWWLNKATEIEMIGKPADEMARETGLPFPSDASKIHYFLHAGGLQYLQIYGKFDCPADRADAIVAEFIDDNDGQLGRGPGALPARQTVTAGPFGTMGSGDFKLPWWDLDPAKVRKAILLNQSHVMQFWIEPSGSTEATIYFYMGD